MISYVDGDVTDVETIRKHTPEGRVIIPHVLTLSGGFGAGVAGSIATRWPDVRRGWLQFLDESQAKRAEGERLMGSVLILPAEEGIYIANMAAQRGFRHSKNPVPLDYDALRNGLAFIRGLPWPDVSVHMPKVGCGLAGGDWDKVEPIVSETLKDMKVYVYNFEPVPVRL